MSSAPPLPRPAFNAPRPCTACCCSTSRSAGPATTRCRSARRMLRAREGRPHRHARSAGQRGCCHCVLVRRPSSRRPRWMPTSAICATVKLGERTASGDAESAVIETRPGEPRRWRRDRGSRSRVSSGPIDQLPPMHSALKHEGRALYDYARQRHRDRTRIASGRRFTASTSSTGSLQQLVIDVACSKGTYIRALAEDIGTALGCGAHLVGAAPYRLRRVELSNKPCRSRHLTALSERSRTRSTCFMPADLLLADWPASRTAGRRSRPFPYRPAPPRHAWVTQAAVRVYARQPRAFLGSAHITSRRTHRRPTYSARSKCSAEPLTRS